MPVERQAKTILAVEDIIQHQIVDAVIAVAVTVTDIEDVAAGDQPRAIVENVQAVAAPDDNDLTELVPVRRERGLGHPFGNRDRQAGRGKIVITTEDQSHSGFLTPSADAPFAVRNQIRA